MIPLTDTQLDRIRETVASTVEEWRNDYGVPECKEYRQLVNRLVAATEAMRQSGLIEVKPINNEPPQGKGGV
jgi:hypothetical protein